MADSKQAAPDSAQIFDVFNARLLGTQHAASIEAASTSAVPMLIDRFTPALRQRIYSFVESRELSDVVIAQDLIFREITRPNIIAAVLATLDPIRKINHAARDYSGMEFDDIKQRCRDLCIDHREEEFEEINFSDIIAVHFTGTIFKGSGSHWDQSAKISRHLLKNPDFLDDAEILIPVLKAVEDSRTTLDRLSAAEIFEFASIIRERPHNGLRILEAIKSHKGYDKAFIDELLAAEATPLENGVL